MVMVEITPAALAQAQALDEPIYSRVLGVIERLRRWPAVSGAKPLRGPLAGHYRVRTGDCRIQFRIQGQILNIERIGHRDGFYED